MADEFGSYIYADVISDWPLGYMEYYDYKYDHVAECYYQKYKLKKDEIKKKLHDERWHFARRIMRTHPYSIPRFVLDMKLRKFIKEVVDKVLDKDKPKQLEFKFE